MSTRIYTMTHKAFDVPENPAYIPMQVGKAVNTDLGYLGDDTGDNISELNCYYGELTGLYWLWKNEASSMNIGVCHYRRFFVNEKRQLLTEQEYEDLLSEYDIITSPAIEIEGSYMEYYGQAHHIEDLEKEGEVICEIYPEYYPAFEQVMAGSRHYYGNLMVTSKKLFDEYCEWLFTIFEELGKVIDVSGYDEYHKRIYGFLSEQLLMVWITAKGLKVYEGQVRITDEKAETRELKLAVGQLLKMEQISMARELFYEVLKLRPDIRLEHSDVLQEIPLIEQILYIIECEMQQEMTGMYAYSKELPQLLTHVKRLRQILAKTEDWDADEQAYLKQNNVTAIAVEILAKNHPTDCDRWQQILERFQSL